MDFSKIATRGLRILGVVILCLATLGVLATAAAYFAGGPIRGYLERKANSHMKAYTIRIGKARFTPISFTLDLYDVKILQNAKPVPPVAEIPHLQTSVHWSQLVRFYVVGDLLMEEPKVHADLTNLKKEQENNYPVRQEGWQEALESIYPLKINVLRIREADLTYIDKGPYKPLRLSRLNVVAQNIRNIESPEGVYPSSIHLDGVVFEKGKVSLEGHANFLAVPHPTVNTEFTLSKMDMEYFQPLTQRYNITMSGGVLSTSGTIEYAIKSQNYQLRDLTIDGPRVDFLHMPETAQKEKQVAHEAASTAKELSNESTVTTEIRTLKIVNGNFGFINKASDPQYRVFFTNAELAIKNFSNQFEKGPAEFRLTGKFMGTGQTLFTGVFRPEKKGPDFDLNIAIENTEMKPMSDLFRAYGNFSVEEGLFSFYSELKVAQDRVNGYVKPMFQNMKVTDNRTKNQKSLSHKLYVGIVKGLKELLENPEKKVATKADISGPLKSPHASTWQVIQNLVQNAFFKSILPGFSENIPTTQK